MESEHFFRYIYLASNFILSQYISAIFFKYLQLFIFIPNRVLLSYFILAKYIQTDVWLDSLIGAATLRQYFRIRTDELLHIFCMRYI